MALVRLDSSLASEANRWHWPASGTTNDFRCDAAASLTLEQIEQRLSALQQWPGKRGRWIGYFSYELGRWLAERPLPPREVDLPLFAFGWSDRSGAPQDVKHSLGHGFISSNFTRDTYLRAVQRSRDYISAGDVYQVNLSQQFTMGLPAQPREIYERLLAQAPAAHGALLDFGDFALISNSPELFLRIEPMRDGRRRIITRPIKGTRPRGPGQEQLLLDSSKDQAELAMIVDLERNDLGRICEIGSVRVTQPRIIEAHPTVFHGVATVEGILRDEVGLMEILRATFPGGSVTGAPKLRAMQIIDEIEPDPRDAYCGAIGYFDADGSIELNVAIRTMMVKDSLVRVSVGGGIVADSEPAAEYEETLVKAQAMFAALGVSDLRG